MIQSVTFGDKNTWDDWRILPTERPVFVPPTLKTLYLDIPGGNGALDMSESLTGYPVYNNRTGTFTFRVMNDYMPWQQRYEEILEYLHGQAMKAILFDNPSWFYQGRFSVDAWKAGNTWSEITIGYNVNPFKWSTTSSTEPWLWDPFNFETGMIWDQTFANITINSTSWVIYNLTADFFGKVPISPTFIISGAPATGMDVIFKNSYLGIDNTSSPMNLKNGTTFVPDIIFYGQTTPYELRLRGTNTSTVTISIDFRVGRL